MPGDIGCDNESVSPTPAQQARAKAIAAEIAALAAAGFALPGTLADRMTRCGRPNCGCHADPPRLHGPYHQWTRKKDGKTATRILTDDQLADYAPGSTTTSGSASSSPSSKPSASPSPRTTPDGTANPRPRTTGAMASGNRGQRPLNLWPARHPHYVSPGQPQT
jgi:hypothetical protein